MRYFQPKKEQTAAHEPVFRVPVDLSGLDELDDDAPLSPEEDEMEQRRRDNLRLMAALGDFLGVVAGVIVILILVAVLASLANWVRTDLMQSFDLLGTGL